MGFRQPEEDEPEDRPRAAVDQTRADLCARHERAAQVLATTYLGNGDHADLVRMAFERTLVTTQPADADGSFCARWFVALRRLVAARATGDGGAGDHRLDEMPRGLRDLPGPTVAPARQAVALRAFGMLPGRLQTVLWQTEVEARLPSDLAVRLGLTPTAVGALATQARARLRAAVLEVRGRDLVRPGCEPHRARLAADVGVARRARTAAAAHIEGCASCVALVGELADLPRALLQALGSLFGRADPVGQDRGRERRDTGVAATAAAKASVLTGARRLAGEVAVRVPVRVGLGPGVGAAAAAVAVVLAIAIVITTGPPGGRGSADDLAGSSSVRAAPSTPTTRPPVPERVDRPPPAAAPRSTRPGWTQPDVVRPGSTPPAPATVAPAPDATAEAPPPTLPVATTPPPRAPVPSPAPVTPVTPVEPDVQVAALPSVGSVVWSAADARVRVTLVNGTRRPTGFLVLTLAALGGSLVSGQPSGCAMGFGAVATAVCALAPLGPGASAAVDVPVRVTGPGQSARVALCSGTALRVDCETELPGPPSVALG
jgi:DNA-directed RNA polymerase specialized sigma24 family protein